MEEKLFGFKPSQIDGTERIFSADETIELPDKYTYRPYLPQVLDQGEQSICVPCTVSAYLNWRENLKDGETKDNKISLFDIYKVRTNKGEGMTYKDAFKFLRHTGVESKAGVLKINAYGMIKKMAKTLLSRMLMIGATAVMLAVNLFSWNFSSISLMLIAAAVSLAVFVLKGAPGQKGGGKG